MKSKHDVIAQIKAKYFSNWDPDGIWQFEFKPDTDGYCDSEKKTIFIGEATEDYSLEVLIIHEIAHATSGDDRHTNKWQDEIRQVEKQAEQHGDQQLAAQLAKHLAWVDGGYDLEPDDIFEVIQTYVNRTGPIPTLGDVRDYLAIENRMPWHLLEKQFPKIPEWYEECVKFEALQSSLRKISRNQECDDRVQ